MRELCSSVYIYINTHTHTDIQFSVFMFTARGPLYETDLLFGGELGELRQAVGQPNKPKEVNSKPYTPYSNQSSSPNTHGASNPKAVDPFVVTLMVTFIEPL